MSLTYLQAAVAGLFQGVSHLLPISSLGHAVLIPALVGDRAAGYLAIATGLSADRTLDVGLHIATAAGLLLFFRRDWARIVGGLVTSIRYRRIGTRNERLAWLVIVATVPFGLYGFPLAHLLRAHFGTPILAATFLIANGLALGFGECMRRTGRPALPAGDDRRCRMSVHQGAAIGLAQLVALLPGVSRSAIAIVADQRCGLSQHDAARFSFLLATPILLGRALFQVSDLTAPLGPGLAGRLLVGCIAAFGTAYVASGALVRYFRAHTLTPFALYCGAVGVGSLLGLTLG